MPTYQITTDKGTYQVDTEANSPTPQDNSQAPAQQGNVQADLAQASSALDSIANPQPKQSSQPSAGGNIEDQVYANLAQFGKNEASVLPFAGRLAQLGGLVAGKPLSPQDMDAMYKNVGDPQGLMQNVSALAGNLVPQLVTMTPFMKGANIIGTAAQDAIKSTIPGMTGKFLGGVANSPMVRGAIGLGAYSGTKTALTGGSGQEINDSTMQGIQTGLIYGALTKAGSTLMPQKLLGKYAETIGSAVGGAIAGAAMSNGGDSATASALLMGGLAALTPEERLDFHKFLANNVSQAQWQNYMRKGLQISEYDTKTILDNGMNEIERVGQMELKAENQTGGTDTLTPVQIAKKFYEGGIQSVQYGEDGNGGISKDFSDAIAASKNINPTDLNDFVINLKKQVDSYGDPTSPIIARFNKTLNALQGFQPTTTETEIAGNKGDQPTESINPRKISMSELPAKMIEQIMREGTSGNVGTGDWSMKAGEKTPAILNLEQLHELKMNMYDAVSDKTWRDPGNTTPDERFAKSIGNQISNYIGKNNELYQKATDEYRKMKLIKSDIMSLNTNNLGKDWNQLDPANRVDLMNKIDGISSYFKQKGVNQYDPKGLLDKYHAYNSINNPDPTSFRNNAPLKIAFERGASMMGAALGLPFGLHGAAIGGSIGYLSAINYMRPSSYIPILKQIKPNLSKPSNMSADEATTTLRKLIARPKADRSKAKQ